MRRLLVVLPLLLSACISAGPAKNGISTAPKAISPDAKAEVEELRASLEQAIAIMESRSSIAPAVVDADATLSMEIPEHRTIHGAVNYFSTALKDSIQASLIRSSNYREMIVSVLDREKLPRGLAYLPVIESAYKPTLTSKAGAHGIWQFMPATAREYGLRVDWWVDERADAEKSTVAAAKYLRDLYREFGDWPLALAAYNCGQGRVRRTMNEREASTFWELLEQSALPKETRGYVPTFYATLLIVSDPEAHGFRLEKAKNPEIEKVPIEGPVTIAHIADAIGVDRTLLKDLNPAYRRGVLPPGISPVRVPPKHAAELRASAERLKFDDVNLPFATFTTRSGDTIERLAMLVGADPEDVRSMNGRRNVLRTGESIYLPVSESRLARLLSEDRERASRKYHLVKKGDTLYSIAKKHDLSIEELAEINDFKATRKLKPGEKVRVRSSQPLTAGGM